MIPTEDKVKALWEKYHLPERKRKHVVLVAKVAVYWANKLDQLGKFGKLNKKLLTAGALLHDIDKNIPRLPGERHPDTGVRILKEEGMEEVAELVATHPLHAILAGSDKIQQRGQAFQEQGQTPSMSVSDPMKSQTSSMQTSSSIGVRTFKNKSRPQYRGQDFQEQVQTPFLAPKRWEEKLLFLADKMVKDDIIGVDERFRLWNEEHLSANEQTILDAAYPKVKELEKEIFEMIRMKLKKLEEMVDV